MVLSKGSGPHFKKHGFSSFGPVCVGVRALEQTVLGWVVCVCVVDASIHIQGKGFEAIRIEPALPGTLSAHMYVYIFICVLVCVRVYVCVCVRVGPW